MTVKVDNAKGTTGEKDYPIICDAVVVTDEEAAMEGANASLPPSTNPNFLALTQYDPASQQPTAAAAATATTTVTAYKIPPPTSTPATYNNLGRSATGMQCPYCYRQTITTTRDIVGVGTIVAVIILAILCWPICWLPFCVPSCRRTHHYCGHDACRKKVGETSVCA